MSARTWVKYNSLKFKEIPFRKNCGISLIGGKNETLGRQKPLNTFDCLISSKRGVPTRPLVAFPGPNLPHTENQAMNVTSFYSISYCSNSEYWTQKHTQNESIHSVILDVYVLKAEHQNFPFPSVRLKLALY